MSVCDVCNSQLINGGCIACDDVVHSYVQSVKRRRAALRNCKCVLVPLPRTCPICNGSGCWDCCGVGTITTMSKQRCEWHDLPTPCKDCHAASSTPVLQFHTATNTAAAPQPPPVKTPETPVVHYVIKDLIDRADVGQRKYGMHLQAHNGRDQLLDAYQEALDLCCYLKGELLRRQGN